MALSTQELNGIRAQWEEWVPEGFELTIEVKAADVDMSVDVGYVRAGELSARAQASALYCQVEVWKLQGTPAQAAICDAYGVPQDTVLPRDRCVFSERVPHEAAHLRASVTVLARTIAGYNQRAMEGDG